MSAVHLISEQLQLADAVGHRVDRELNRPQRRATVLEQEFAAWLHVPDRLTGPMPALRPPRRPAQWRSTAVVVVQGAGGAGKIFAAAGPAPVSAAARAPPSRRRWPAETELAPVRTAAGRGGPPVRLRLARHGFAGWQGEPEPVQFRSIRIKLTSRPKPQSVALPMIRTDTRLKTSMCSIQHWRRPPSGGIGTALSHHPNRGDRSSVQAGRGTAQGGGRAAACPAREAFAGRARGLASPAGERSPGPAVCLGLQFPQAPADPTRRAATQRA